MSDQNTCPLCKNQLKAKTDVNDGLSTVTCDVCGEYNVERILLITQDLPLDARVLLSAIARRSFEYYEEQITINRDNWQGLVSQSPAKNDVPSKVRYLLNYIAHRSRFPSDTISLNGQTDYPICFASNTDEFTYYIQYAKEAGFLGDDPLANDLLNATKKYKLTVKGWEEIRHVSILDSPYAFVAMAFKKDGDQGPLLADAFEQAIRPAIEEDTGYEKAIRIDKEEFLGDIVFEIIARIKECRFLIADVTNHRNGVYFEAGYAMGMGLPVIWTCHKDDMIKAHFDTNHLNHIEWDNIDDLRKRLANRILATIGRGPRNKNDY
jgi:nucleoside 2-deoxyribosyltransferase